MVAGGASGAAGPVMSGSLPSQHARARSPPERSGSRTSRRCL